jgi:hypothetical protein
VYGNHIQLPRLFPEQLLCKPVNRAVISSNAQRLTGTCIGGVCFSSQSSALFVPELPKLCDNFNFFLF